MFTGITTHAGALVIAIVALTGGAILGGGAAAADSNQDDQFLVLLDKEEIPAVENVPSVIAAGHAVCRELDGGTPVDDVVDAMRNDAYEINPRMRLHRARVTSTMTRFITAAVDAYCPYDQSKIASIMANPAPGSNEPTGTDVVRLPHLMDGGVFVAGRYRDDRSDCYVHGTVLVSLIEAPPSGEITPPNPPQIPAPPPPTAQIRTPPRANASPPSPQELPPSAPPEEKPPPPEQLQPPQQVEPPAAPQPGGAAGSGGSGSNGGNGGGGSNGAGGPAEPSRTPHMPPGFVRLAP
jgi:uncharacterized membrane protein YgcG